MSSKIDGGGKGADFDIGQLTHMAYDGIEAAAGVGASLTKTSDPIAMGIDTVVGAIGAPKILGDAAKLGVGIGMAIATDGAGTDPMLIANGAFGLVHDGMEMMEPYVEFPQGSIHVGENDKGEFGYSIDAHQDAPGMIPWSVKSEMYVGGPLGALGNMLLGGAGSTSHDASAVNPNQSGGPHCATPPPGQGTYANPPVGFTPPPPPGNYPVDPGFGHVTTPPAGPTAESTLSGDTLKYYQSLQVLLANYETVDAADPRSTGFKSQEAGITWQDLDYFRTSKDPKLQDAAQFFLQHPEYFNRASGGNAGDGKISKMEIHAELHELDEQIKLYGSPSQSTSSSLEQIGNPPGWKPEPGMTKQIASPSQPAPTQSTQPTSPAQTTQPTAPSQSTPSTPSQVNNSNYAAEIQAILGDKSLSAEEKIELILEKILDSLDASEESVASQMADAAIDLGKAQDAAKDSKTGNADVAAKQNNLNELQRQIQKITERRSQMFNLLSTFSEKNNELAKAAIQNMGRA